MSLKYSKIISFSLIITLFFTSQQNFAASNNQNVQSGSTLEQNGKVSKFDSMKASLDTTQRVILQSIIETFWNLIKENKNTKVAVIKANGKEYKLDLTEFGKILSNLAVDEIIPTPKQNIQQKIAELLTPAVVACIITKVIPSVKEKEYANIPADLGDLGIQLLTKLLMVRFFLKPGTTKYNIANCMAILGAFYRYDPKKSGLWKYASIQRGITKLTQEEIKNIVETSNLGEKLNKPHRKKAIRKILQVLIEPYLELLMDKACIPN